jgi:NAD(P)H dehydrogenase (quinone)
MSWMPGRVTPEERQAYLDSYATRLRSIESTEPLFFHPHADYGPDQRLKPGVVARSGFQWNPAIGQSHAEAAEVYTPTKIARAG